MCQTSLIRSVAGSSVFAHRFLFIVILEVNLQTARYDCCCCYEALKVLKSEKSEILILPVPLERVPSSPDSF